MLKIVYIWLIILVCVSFCGCRKVADYSHVPSNVEDAKIALEKILDDRDLIFSRRVEFVDSLKTELSRANNIHDSLSAAYSVAFGYMHFQVDSFMKYSDMAIGLSSRCGDEELEMSMKLYRIESLPLLLLLSEAAEGLDSIDSKSLSNENRRLFYDVGRRVYLYFTTIHSSGQLYDGFLSKFSEYNDSLLSMLEPSDPYYKLYLGTHYLNNDNLPYSIALLSEQISDMPIDDPKYSDAASMLALSYFLRGREQMWRYAMTLVAISEIKICLRDGESLRRLASGYYNVGQEEFAYRLMIESDKNVAESGAIMRCVHISEDIPLISEAYFSSQKSSRISLYIIIFCLVALTALGGISLFSKVKDRARLGEMAGSLERANTTKDVYISQFVTLCSTYVDKMDDFNKLVLRKLTAGQVEELFQLVKTEKIVDEQRKLFFDIFDEAFMQIYPTFIQDVNSLLKDDSKLRLEDGHHLTPELRILAFMRLGLEGSSQMARFLGLSINTVYTYRNKMKSRAINRDTFERDVASIGVNQAK